MLPPASPLKEYLGDGVYAQWNGMHVVLTAEDGVQVQATIYLEDFTIENLNSFYRRAIEGRLPPE